MNKKSKYIVSTLFGILVLLYFYTFLHEAGHALVAILCGGKVNKLVLGLNAHVQTSGANFTLYSEALFNVAGALLPVIFLLLALAFYKPTIKNTFYHIFYGGLWVVITGSLLAWVIVPLLALFTLPPVGDDITKFLNITSLHPLIVTLVALLIIATMIFLVYIKGLLIKIKEINNELLPTSQDKTRKSFLIRLLIGIVVGVIIVVAGLNIIIPKPVFKTSFSMEVSPMYMVI